MEKPKDQGTNNPKENPQTTPLKDGEKKEGKKKTLKERIGREILCILIGGLTVGAIWGATSKYNNSNNGGESRHTEGTATELPESKEIVSEE